MARAVERALVDCALVVAAWGALVFNENVLVALLWGPAFSGAWEVAQARRLVAPLALAGLAPASLTVVGWWWVARRASDGSRLARRALGALGMLAGGALGLGVSTGRHFASALVRAPFVLGLAAVGLVAAVAVGPRLARLVGSPVALGLTGVGVCGAAWLADATVLPRLYPAFHAALLVACLSGAAVAGLSLRGLGLDGTRGRVLAAVVALFAVASALRAPHAVRALEPFANLRVALVEHAPVLGRAVEVTTWLSEASAPDAEGSGCHAEASEFGAEPSALHAEPSDCGAAPSALVPPGEVARALDWSGHDLVLLTVDALRADHVSAYGYARPTTPGIDALARQGTLFDAAYCPTPHTSYSVTSLMTGKYLRPLLALGLGEDSETWAQDLRHYGWRTAAFYPPAVFYIDEDRFASFERSELGFEYAKVEFADPALREQQVAGYLESAPSGTPLFLWVHFFEPHEPYVAHPEHPFAGGPSADVDRYDAEVATADDGIARVVKLVRSRRPGAVVVVTADHGEEFGEHGGRYHGTTVYEEQVRVPLVVVGPGVRGGARVATAVQTIDLLPTALSALGIPRPARLRGRDLGPLLATDAGDKDEGFAFAETDDYALVAEGGDRLVCQRRAAACSLYWLKDDPLERTDRASDAPDRFAQLRGTLRAVERDHGQLEGGARGATWPEALRRGLQGDVEAAPDVAALLDDADVGIRRKAAAVCYALRAPSTVASLRRSLAKDEDDEVRRWASLALARAGEPAPALAQALLRDPSREWRRRAALALGERADARACDELGAWWDTTAPAPNQAGKNGEAPQIDLELASVRELLEATSKARCRSAVPSLVRALADVRARPYVADALGQLGDDRAQAPLLALLATEPYVTTRRHEAQALVALGARDWPARGTTGAAGGAERVTLRPARGTARVLVLLSDAHGTLDATADGAPLATDAADGEVRSVTLAPASTRGPGPVELHAAGARIVAAWLD